MMDFRSPNLLTKNANRCISGIDAEELRQEIRKMLNISATHKS